jgi:protein-tyrosine kinase
LSRRCSTFVKPRPAKPVAKIQEGEFTMYFDNIIEKAAAKPGETVLRSETRGLPGPHTDLASQAVPVNTIFAEAPSFEELQLVQRLFFLPDDEAPRVTVVCGIGGTGNGAVPVCARAAEVLASQVKEKVCLVDANLKDPTLHHRYDLDKAIQEVGSDPLEQTAMGTPIHRRLDNLWILPGGALRERCSGLSPDWVRAELSGLKERFGFLLICAPPLESALDGLLLGRVSDGIVLVLNAYSTYRADVLKVRRSLERYRIRLLGAVVDEQQPANDALDRVLEGAGLGLQKVQREMERSRRRGNGPRSELPRATAPIRL